MALTFWTLHSLCQKDARRAKGAVPDRAPTRSGNLAIFTAIFLASSPVSNFAAETLPIADCSGHKKAPAFKPGPSYKRRNVLHPHPNDGASTRDIVQIIYGLFAEYGAGILESAGWSQCKATVILPSQLQHPAKLRQRRIIRSNDPKSDQCKAVSCFASSVELISKTFTSSCGD
jgi:hypothetical protein